RQTISRIVRDALNRENATASRFYADALETQTPLNVKGHTMKWYNVEGDVETVVRKANRRLREAGVSNYRVRIVDTVPSYVGSRGQAVSSVQVYDSRLV